MAMTNTYVRAPCQCSFTTQAKAALCCSRLWEWLSRKENKNICIMWACVRCATHSVHDRIQTNPTDGRTKPPSVSATQTDLANSLDSPTYVLRATANHAVTFAASQSYHKRPVIVSHYACMLDFACVGTGEQSGLFQPILAMRSSIAGDILPSALSSSFS